ncbi:MAG: hypothetical protein AAF985_23725, partial [Bacteroidota bacterium]
MMRLQYLVISIMVLSQISAMAQNGSELQNKQQVFADPEIVWAAYFEIDVVPDLPLEQIRQKHARLPNLIEGYGQLSHTLKFFESAIDTSRHQMLNGFILGQTESIEFYEAAGPAHLARSQKLNNRLHHWNLALEDVNVEPETFGTYQMLPRDYFEVFRLKGILYYRKDVHNFYAIPEAVALLKNLDGDSKAVWDYEVVAWMPVSDALKQSGWNTDLTTWAQNIERSIPLTDLFVFKQDWTSDEVFAQQTGYLRKNAEQIKVQHPYPVDLDYYMDLLSNGMVETEDLSPEQATYMTSKEVQQIATYEEVALRE